MKKRKLKVQAMVRMIEHDAPADEEEKLYAQAFASVKQRILDMPLDTGEDVTHCHYLIMTAFEKQLEKAGYTIGISLTKEVCVDLCVLRCWRNNLK